MARLLFCDEHMVIAIHPETGDLQRAVLEEDWFGPMKDAIRFPRFNSPHYLANDVQWDFAEKEAWDALG